MAVLVVLPGAWMIGIAEQRASASLERVIARELAREARHTAERLSSVLRSERETLVSFARQDLMREIRVADIDKRISQALVTLRGGSELRVDYWVLDLAEDVVASSDPALLSRTPSEPPPPAGSVRRSGRRLILSAPVPDPDAPERQIGTLVGVLRWDRVLALTRDVRRELAELGLEADLLVADAAGEILGGAWQVPPGDALQTRLRGAVAGEPAGRDAAWIVGHAALAGDLPHPLSTQRVFVVESRSAALAPARALSRRLMATMGLVLLLALAVAALGARRVVRPLTELTAAIRGLAQGDAGAKRVPVRSEDEVGTLGLAFNQMAEDLDRAQHDLVEAEKFAFVGELAAGIAHEIRTSLGVLRSAAQLLEQSLPADAGGETAELAQMLGAEVDRLGSVVNDLLTLDSPQPLQLRPVALSEPLGRARAFVLPRATAKDVAITLETPPDEPSVRGEPELVYRVAVNLLVNALEAVDEGGHVELAVRPGRDGFGGFDVRDDGRGIPPDLLERIFQPFFTARAGGVGLGLTFVKRVIHDHHGRISVTSTPGAGTRFHVELPLAQTLGGTA